MLAGLFAVSLASVLVAMVAGFWVTPVLYMTIGVSFALMKGAVYSTVGLITREQHEHTSLMNVLEGVFQVGALTGPLFFSLVLGLHYTWRTTYWIIAAVSAMAFAAAPATPLDESEVEAHSEQAGFVEMLRLLRLPVVWVFVLCAWLYVMIEQSFGTWLPDVPRAHLRPVACGGRGPAQPLRRLDRAEPLPRWATCCAACRGCRCSSRCSRAPSSSRSACCC